jgi:hypothetical protein
MNGAIPLLPLQAFMAWTGTILHFIYYQHVKYNTTATIRCENDDYCAQRLCINRFPHVLKQLPRCTILPTLHIHCKVRHAFMPVA